MDGVSTHEVFACPAIQLPWVMIAASCSHQRNRYNHPDHTHSDQCVARESLRSLGRDAQVKEEHGCL
jgi:hypothetical protein